MAKPSFIGIGAQKCASTWVYRVLEDHPECRTSTPKELDFFSYRFDRGFQWYESHFEGPAAGAIGEVSPSYFHDAEAPARVRAYRPGMRIVLTLRDPIARAYSNHLHEIRTGHYTGPDLSFEAGLANNPMYVEQSRYAKHLQRWLAHFPREQLLILLQEEIQADPVRQAQALYDFLGIDRNHQSAFLFKRANESYGEKLKGVDSALRRVGRIGRRVGAAQLVEKVKRNALVLRMRDANREHLTQWIPPMAAQTRELMQELLAEDMAQLQALLGRMDLPWAALRSVTGARVAAQ